MVVVAEFIDVCSRPNIMISKSRVLGVLQQVVRSIAMQVTGLTYENGNLNLQIYPSAPFLS
jgi:hypothetical protein